MHSSDDLIELILDDQNRVKIHLHGATIISWTSGNGENLFLSKKAIFDNKKPIRGGIPIVFPNFGAWGDNRPTHGFARIKRWQILDPVSRTNDSCVEVKLGLVDDEETRAWWDYKFELIYHVTLTKNTLKTLLTVKNTNADKDFDFTGLLHTYFRVDDIQNVKIYNLSGLEFKDKARNGQLGRESGEYVSVSEEIDRGFINSPDVQILRFSSGSEVTIEKQNFPDTEVWNPWAEKSKAMADLDDNEYKEMICVEPGFICQKCSLKAMQSLTMGQTLSVKQS